MFVGLGQQLQAGHGSLLPGAGLSGLDGREEIRNKTNKVCLQLCGQRVLGGLELEGQKSKLRGQGSESKTKERGQIYGSVIWNWNLFTSALHL